MHRTAIWNVHCIYDNERSNPITIQRSQPNLLNISTLQQLQWDNKTERILTESRFTRVPGNSVVVLSTFTIACPAPLTNVSPLLVAFAWSWYVTFPEKRFTNALGNHRTEKVSSKPTHPKSYCQHSHNKPNGRKKSNQHAPEMACISL